ncbi:MAG: hypothetical protein OIF50_00410 [Flavobacteriaceae bacterium]|nr:hypothetical protein [Flavobacteriaceae bacterium]
MSSLLATNALELGKNGVILDSYWKYFQKKQTWFFSINPTLVGATNRPKFFEKREHWKLLNMYQRTILLDLASLSSNLAKKENLEDTFFEDLYFVYVNLWPYNLYAIFWDVPNSPGSYLSAAFIGDTIYKQNGKNFTNTKGHYIEAKEILSEHGPLSSLKEIDLVEIGDIVCFNKEHMEVITKITKHASSPHRFCSVGAGRGFSPYSNAADGEARCDSYIQSRELAHDGNQYFRFK